MVDDQLRVQDVRDLHAFMLACQLRSLSAVAKQIGESVATVSRRISRLESAVDVALLHRSSRGIEPTEDGIAYRGRIAHVLELLGAANAATGRTAEVPAGTLRLSIPPGLTDVLAPVLADFCTAYPKVALVVDVSSRFVDLDADRFDVALRATGRLVDSSLVAVRLAEPTCGGILVASPSYVKQHGAPRRLEDLAAHRILAHGDTVEGYRMPVTKRGASTTTRIALPVAIAATDLGFLKSMALAGAGIAALPHVSVHVEIEDDRLVHVLPAYQWPTGGLYLLHRGGAYVAPKVRAFIDHAKSALARR